ncbi:MAG: AAA family ATPase [Solirubrobacterales bacterium]
MVSIRLLGPPRVDRDGKAVSFDTRKAVALLAHLALSDRPRSRDALCALLWPAQDNERARGALRRTLSTLRGAIGEEWVETEADSVGLRRGEQLELDIDRFRRLAGADDVAALAEAADLCSGALLEGFSVRDSPEFEHWLEAQARGMSGELVGVLQRLVRALTERGEYPAAIAYTRRWLAAEPLHESAHRELIRLYALSGDRAAALAQYRDCVRTLTEELGVGPVEETTALFEQVSEGTLAPPAPAAARPKPEGGGSQRLAFVGRGSELRRLLEAFTAVDRDGGMVVVEGEAGIGKTRLVEEFANRVGLSGSVVISARCHDDAAGAPYAPILDLLRQRLATAESWIDDIAPQRLADASLLVPELADLRPELPAPLSITGPVAQARLLEGVAAVLGAAPRGGSPGVVFVDDVHAADTATVDVLAYLGRRLRGWPNLLLMSWRSEYMPAGHRLRRLAGEPHGGGAAATIRLDRLTEAQVSELVRVAEPTAGDELAHRIYLESEGLPLFVSEYVAAIGVGEGEELPSLPGEVRTALEARLAGLDSISRQAVGAAAVLGRRFGFDILRATSGRDDEETVDALEALVVKGLLVQAAGGEAEYEFSHQKLRQLVYEGVSLPRRRLLHRRAAAALRPMGATEASIAQHLREAGELEEAAIHFERAADHAAALHAHADALGFLQAAAACDSGRAPPLQERIGDLQTLLGDYAAALTSYETAAATADGAALAALEHKLALVHQRRGEWDRAETRLAAALGAAPGEASGLRARIVADLALTLHRSGELESARERAVDAGRLAAAADDARAMAQAHNLLGMLARADGELDESRDELTASLQLAEAMDDEVARVAALNNLALVARAAGDLDQALALTESALSACAEYGDRHREAALENNLADLHHAAGDAEASMEHLKRAVSIFAEVGGDEATRLPEIWKLVSW